VWVFCRSGGGLWYALKGSDWEHLRSTILGVDSLWLIFLFPIVLLIEYAFRTARFYVLLKPLTKTSWRSLFPITIASFFVNNVVPFRAGELARTYWTSHRTGVSFSGCLAVLTADRLFDMMTLLAFALTLMAFHPASLASPRVVVFFILLTGGGFATLWILSHRRDKFSKWGQSHRFPIKLAEFFG